MFKKYKNLFQKKTEISESKIPKENVKKRKKHKFFQNYKICNNFLFNLKAFFSKFGNKLFTFYNIGIEREVF